MTEYVYLAGLMLLPVMFLLSGFQKIDNYALVQGYMVSLGVPGILLPPVIALEVIGPLLIVLAWYIRLATVALAGFSVLAAVLFHVDFADRTQMIMCMWNITIAGGLLLWIANGAGEISMDFRNNQ